jgi:4-hydroxy-2-oxoglutarate aldolase
MSDMKGIYTPIITPFDEQENIQYDFMLHNLGKWGETDLDGIVVLGSNGEFVYLTEQEKIEIFKFVKNNFTNSKKLIAGTFCESTKNTIEFSKKMADLGADAVLILPPNYYKGGMKDEILYQHFTDIADECPIPVMLYNMPGNTGINLNSSLIARLSKHPNITGIKDTGGNIVQMAEVVRDTDDDFAVFAGNASYLLAALEVGARGATLALANILAQDCCELVEMFKRGEHDKARAAQINMLHINAAVTLRFGVSGLKYAMGLLGYKGGHVRRPLRPLSQENRQIVDKIVDDYLKTR